MTSVILGFSSEAQFRENCHAAELVLAAAEVAALDAASAPTPQYPGWFQARTADAAVAGVARA